VIIFALNGTAIVSAQRRGVRPRRPPVPSATQTPTPLATLSIEAGLVYTNGDTKPVARTVFYLLDKDVLGEAYDTCSKDPMCGAFMRTYVRTRNTPSH